MFDEILGNLAVQVGKVFYHMVRCCDLGQDTSVFVCTLESHGSHLLSGNPMQINDIRTQIIKRRPYGANSVEPCGIKKRKSVGLSRVSFNDTLIWQYQRRS